jgi:hypothetical protein
MGIPASVGIPIMAGASFDVVLLLFVGLTSGPARAARQARYRYGLS